MIHISCHSVWSTFGTSEKKLEIWIFLSLSKAIIQLEDTIWLLISIDHTIYWNCLLGFFRLANCVPFVSNVSIIQSLRRRYFKWCVPIGHGWSINWTFPECDKGFFHSETVESTLFELYVEGQFNLRSISLHLGSLENSMSTTNTSSRILHFGRIWWFVQRC